MRLRLTVTALLLLLAVAFHHAASAPVALVDTWRHWKYGEWIWQHEGLPDREPLDPAYTEQDKPFVDTAWLGEVVGYLAMSSKGTRGVSIAAGIVEALKTLFLFLAFRRGGTSSLLALIGAALVQSGLWSSTGMFRPQLLGELCGAVVLFLLGTTISNRERDNNMVGLEDSTHPTFLVPLVFLLWANLDSSFIIGLVWLALLLIGRVLDGKPPGRLALITALSAVAVCVNPDGPRLISAAVAFMQAQIQSTPDWQPPVSPRLPEMSAVAWALVASVAAVLVTLRISPKRFTSAEILLLLVFGIATWFISRLLPWWLMVCGWVLLPHWREVLGRPAGARAPDSAAQNSDAEPHSPDDWIERSKILFPTIAGLAYAAAIYLVLNSAVFLSGQLHENTPIELTERLVADARLGPRRIFVPLPWSDYLLWRLPATSQLFLYNRFEVFRPRQRLYYDRILMMRTGDNDWRTLLDRFGIDVLALSAGGSGKDLFAWFLYNREPGWQLAYVNKSATELIAVRER
jgi:hypothetical protein